VIPVLNPQERHTRVSFHCASRLPRQLSVLVRHVLEKGMPDAHHHAAFFLRLAWPGVNSLTDIGDGHIFLELHLTGVLVHLDLRSCQTDLPEGDHTAQRNAACAAMHAAADQFATGRPEYRAMTAA
jgi:hypothetical protein